MGISRTTLTCGVVLMFAITVLCPAARGDSILFTTTITATDSWHPKETDGPFSGAGEWSLDREYSGTISGGRLYGYYIAESDTLSTFASKILPGGEVQVGKLQSSGEVVGYDLAAVLSTVNFSMTIGETQPLPPSAPPAPSIPFFFYPTLYADCTTETFFTDTSTCEAEASASIVDTSRPSTPGSSGSATLPVSGTGSATIYPAFEINTYEGDRMTITLTTGLKLGGLLTYVCAPGPIYCQAQLNSEAHAIVDPLFEFDQQAFNAEMGANTYPLSEYYQFEFSRNIPNVPHIPTVPEPSSLLLLGTGMAGICLAALRKK